MGRLQTEPLSTVIRQERGELDVLPLSGGKPVTLRLKSAEQRALGDALGALGEGDNRAFLDQMWLTFGDGWTGVVDALAAHGYVTPPDQDAYDGCRITERGTGLAQRLMGLLAKSA